jgi:glucuronate isomerase
VETRALREAVLKLPVWDTHTHLIGSRLAARDFWEIGHYFWFLLELKAAGYPQRPDALAEGERIDAFLRAFEATRNTSMNWCVRQIFGRLYGVELSDAASVRRADEAVRTRAAEAGWARHVCTQANVQRIVVNEVEDAAFANLDGVSCLVPRVEPALVKLLGRLRAAASGAAVEAELGALLDEHVARGCGGVMTSLEPFTHLKGPTTEEGPPGSDPESQQRFLLHSLARAAQARGLFLQFLTGIEAGWGGGRVPINDPHRIVRLYGLFERHQCQFELVLGSNLNNLDAVQAGWIFPHVNVGGMWWYNFRASTYRDSFQYRLEALPPAKSPIVVSDARCIEWCFGKVLLIKHLLADFLGDQIERGFLEPDDAPRVAAEWLHGAAARRYAPASAASS